MGEHPGWCMGDLHDGSVSTPAWAVTQGREAEVDGCRGEARTVAIPGQRDDAALWLRLLKGETVVALDLPAYLPVQQFREVLNHGAELLAEAGA